MLTKGQTIKLPDGELYRVLRVSISGAYVAPVKAKVREFKAGVTEKKVRFEAPGRGFQISAQSEVEVMG